MQISARREFSHDNAVRVKPITENNTTGMRSGLYASRFSCSTAPRSRVSANHGRDKTRKRQVLAQQTSERLKRPQWREKQSQRLHGVTQLLNRAAFA
jgi:hypothetical protein